MLELWPDQRHAGQFALGDKVAGAVDHHPGAVEFQAGLDQQRLVHLDAGAGFDRVDEQARDRRLDVEIGSIHGSVPFQEPRLSSTPPVAKAPPTMPRWLFLPRSAFAAPASSDARWRFCWR